MARHRRAAAVERGREGPHRADREGALEERQAGHRRDLVQSARARAPDGGNRREDPRLEVELSAALVPGADAQGLALEHAARGRPRNLLVVGHEPDCGELVSELTGDHAGDHAFKKAGIARLEGSLEPGGMQLLWHLAPKDVLG